MTASLPTLYTLASEYADLVGMLEDEWDPSNEEQTSAILSVIEHVGGQLSRKVEATAVVIRALELASKMRAADARTLNHEADLLAEQSEGYLKRAERLKRYVLEQLHVAEMDRIETPRFRVHIRLNNPAVQITDPDALPNEYKRTKISVEPDKVKIKAAMLDDGEVVPGCQITRGERLEIR